MDYIDREKAKRHARDNVENMYDDHYVRGQGADQYDPVRTYLPISNGANLLNERKQDQYQPHDSYNRY